MIFLGIGSNLSSSYGDRFYNIDLSISYLESYGILLVKKSSYYETPSYPDISKPKFINVVISVKTNLPPVDLMSVLIFIERKIERERKKKNDPRTCDIDILDYKGQIISSEYEDNEFTIQHKKLSFRNFVLYDAASPTISLQVLFYKTHICTSIKKLKLTESFSSFGI